MACKASFSASPSAGPRHPELAAYGWPAEMGSPNSYVLKDDLDFAIHSVRREYEIDRPTEFVRNQIAYQAGAIAGCNFDRHLGATELAPLEHELHPLIQVLPVP